MAKLTKTTMVTDPKSGKVSLIPDDPQPKTPAMKNSTKQWVNKINEAIKLTWNRRIEALGDIVESIESKTKTLESGSSMLSADGFVLKVGDSAWIRHDCEGHSPFKVKINQISRCKILYSETYGGSIGANKGVVFKIESNAYWKENSSFADEAVIEVVGIKNENTPTKFRVWWIPNAPMNAFFVYVDSPEEGAKICDVLANYDLFQYKNNIKTDYSNTGGIQSFDPTDDFDSPGGSWSDWCPDDDEEFSEWRENLERE